MNGKDIPGNISYFFEGINNGKRGKYFIIDEHGNVISSTDMDMVKETYQTAVTFIGLLTIIWR